MQPHIIFSPLLLSYEQPNENAIIEGRILFFVKPLILEYKTDSRLWELGE